MLLGMLRLLVHQLFMFRSYFIEAIDYKTPVQCAQLCLNDAGCLSFDAGVVGDFQEGDCFLSYDNRKTAPAGNFQAVSQLSYYEKLNYGLFVKQLAAVSIL
jgi:hypothetical protein